MQPILVTGGAGYIGGHVCKALHEANFTPIVFDNLSSGLKQNVQWGELYIGDLLDKTSVQNAFKLYNPLGVIHLAALINIQESIKNPILFYQVNIQGSINLLETMQMYKVSNLLFASSCAVYGNSAKNPSENTAPIPLNPYARSKLFAEEIIKDVSQNITLNYMILRLFNVAGLDTESHLRRTYREAIIPRLIDIAYQKRKEFFAYTHHDTFDGSSIRDYIHVKDVAATVVKALECMLNGKSNKIINVGSGKGYSVKEIIQTIEEILSCKIPQKENSLNETKEIIADITLLRNVLGEQLHFKSIKKMIGSECCINKK